MFKLRPYQEKTKKDIEYFLSESSFKKGLIVKPVGTGKALDTAIISQLTNNNCLVVQPNSELLIQNLEKARMFGLNPSIYSSSMDSKCVSSLTYATPLSISSKPELFKDFKTVIIDEAHIGMTNTLRYGKVEKKGKFNKFLEYIKPNKIIGLTATPIQLVNTRLGSELKIITRSRRSFWNLSTIFHVTQISEIKDKYWANIKFVISNDSDNSKLLLNSTGSEFTEKSIIKSYEENFSDEKILKYYDKLLKIGKSKILTFVPNVEIGKNLKKLNADFEFLHSATPKEERVQLINRFKSGDIKNLINCETLTTGFDFPELDAIIVARNTNSFSLYYQIIGRLVRPIIKSDGSIFKKEAIVVDLTSNYSRFGSIENISFEKNDYTKGWAMWNNDMIMTGSPFGNWDMPKRKDIINHNIINNKDGEVCFTFGKYKGEKVSDVFKKDPRYINWLTKSTDFSWNKYLDIKKEIEYLLKNKIINE